MNKKYYIVVIAIVIIAAIIIIQNRRGSSQEPVVTQATSSQSQSVKASGPVSENEDNKAEFSVSLPFSFADYPDIHFKVTKIKKEYNPTADYTRFAQGMKNPALVTVDLEIINNSDKSLDANFFQLLYGVDTNGVRQTLMAPYYIHTSYETKPMSSIVVNPTFIIPNEQDDASLVVGIYPAIIYQNVEEILSKSTNSFLVDFKQKKAWQPEG